MRDIEFCRLDLGRPKSLQASLGLVDARLTVRVKLASCLFCGFSFSLMSDSRIKQTMTFC